MTNYANGAHSATGAATGRMDAGAGNTFGTFGLQVSSNAPDSVVALETSPDNTVFTEVARVTGSRWGQARTDHRQRYARVNVINLGTGGAPIASNIVSYP